MAYVFRFHDGKNIKGWEESSPLNEKAIKAIKDPNGADSSREITSIPSPFARIDLVRTAFKEVSNIGINGNTIYHKMVSDALDIGQIFYNADKYSDKIEILSWDQKGDLDRLMDSTNPQHKILGESLRLYLDQDQKVYNFDSLNKFYLINYTKGPDSMNIIGGTSPSTLFFTSANDFHLEGFQEGEDKLLDDNYKPLHQRDPEYIKYLFSLRTAISDFSSKMKELDDYMELVYQHLDANMKEEVSDLGGYYESLPNLNIPGKSEVVELLGIHLKKAKDKRSEILKSDFVIKADRENLEGDLPLVLPTDVLNFKLKYVSAPWQPTSKAPFYDPNEPHSRILPYDGNKYPYLTVGDFLEPVLIRTQHPINLDYFYNGGISNSKTEGNGYLLPIKSTYFKYFKPITLTQKINGEKVFELKPLTNGYVEAVLRIPIQQNQHITYSRIYSNPVNQAHKPEFDEDANKGAIMESLVNLGITPFYKFPQTVHPEYNIALYEGGYIFDDINYELECYNEDNIKISNSTKVQRRFKDEEGYNMYGELVKSNFDYIKLKQNYATGVVLPNFFENVGGTSKFKFSIDFGTTNTHIEYSKDDGLPKPLEIPKSEKYQIGSLIAFENFQDAYLSNLRVDLFPEEIKCDETYQFPQRTAVHFHKNTNFNQPIVSFGNIGIPFKYEKGPFDRFSNIQTNLKWNHANEDNRKKLRGFFEAIIKLIRNKVLLDGGNIDDTQIIWSYPASMLKHQLDRMGREWQEIIRDYLGESVTIDKVCESLTPFYFYTKHEGDSAMEKPMVSMDIGGGTSDVAVYSEELPILFSSYKFAGDAVFGDNYNRNININGFVNRYHGKVIRILEENNQKILAGTLEKIKEENSSHDLISAYFSLNENKELVDKNIEIDFSEFLIADAEFKIIFLLFYTSQVYHVTHLLKAKDIPVPGLVSFSGTASKLLNIIDSSGDKNTLQTLTAEIFKEVYALESLPEIEIKLPKNPKQISSKGGLCVVNHSQLNLSEIKQTLITNLNLQSQNGNSISYKSVKEYEKNAMISFDEFFDFFFSLNKRFSFRDNFGIEKATLDYTKDFIDKKKVNALKVGIKNKLSEISNESEEEINETLFFYPLVGTLGELAFELNKTKVS